MYKVFLVEDEIVVRESVRDNVAWERTSCVLAGEASDGEMALPLIEEIRPDVLITDIKMPFMDGLSLARIVRRNMPWVKVVIISGYDEFSFAREAIGIGVTEYLLKPISSGDLIEALNRVTRQIEAETREREKVEDLNRCLKDSRQVIAERFLNDLVTGVIPSAEAIERAEGFGINLVGRCWVIAVVSPAIKAEADPHRVYEEYLKAEGLLHRLLEGNPDVILFSRNLRETVLIFRGEDPAELDSHCYSVCQSVKYEVERRTGCSLTISVGGVRERIAGIAESYRDAEDAHRYRYIYGENRIVGIDDARRANFRGSDILKLDCGGLVEALRTGDREALSGALSGYLSRIGAGNVGSFLYGYAALSVALEAARFVEELGGRIEEVLPGLDRMEGLLSGGPEPGPAEEYLERTLQAAFDFRERCRTNKYADVILRARSYIGEHYSDPEVSLNTVAGHVHVSPSHFSTIFSQETGQTFIEHLTAARIARAKELLKSSSLRSSEIAWQVGYKDPHYFSYIFKRHCGCTPSEFRGG